MKYDVIVKRPRTPTYTTAALMSLILYLLRPYRKHGYHPPPPLADALSHIFPFLHLCIQPHIRYAASSMEESPIVVYAIDNVDSDQWGRIRGTPDVT